MVHCCIFNCPTVYRIAKIGFTLTNYNMLLSQNSMNNDVSITSSTIS